MRWIIRGWPGPSADGLGPRLAPNSGLVLDRTFMSRAYIVAAHHSGIPLFPVEYEDIDVFGNEGLKISEMLETDSERLLERAE